MSNKIKGIVLTGDEPINLETHTPDARQQLFEDIKNGMSDFASFGPEDNNPQAKAEDEQDKFATKVDEKSIDDDVPDEMRGLMVLSCAELVAFYPASQKPYKKYEDIRDACYNDFQVGEGRECVPYLDCDGHLTIGVGILLNHKSHGEKGLDIDGKNRFDLYGFNSKQKEAAIKATEMLNPSDYMNKDGIFTVAKKDEKTGETYYISMERIKGAGARLLWVQKNYEKIVRMPFVKQEVDKKVFDKVFPSYFATVKNQPQLYSMPKEMQMSLIHQVWAAGHPPAGTSSIKTPAQAYNACMGAIAARGAVSQGEKNQIVRARSCLDMIYDNALHSRTVRADSVSPVIAYDKNKEKEAYEAYKNKVLNSYRKDAETGNLVIEEVIVSPTKGKGSKNSDKRNFWQKLFTKRSRSA